jgi:dihydroxyacetone kinase-like protein
MTDSATIKKAFAAVSGKMAENRDYLIELDSQNGDGDLGISMDNGFKATSAWLEQQTETDLGQLLRQTARTLNESSPSSLGTILSHMILGMAKTLRGKTQATYEETVAALEAGVGQIQEKAGSKPGEKTVLDALCPAVETLKATEEDVKGAFKAAAAAAAAGSESTREMRAVHGRAAYYGDKSIGVLDGGSAVGKLIFEALAEIV